MALIPAFAQSRLFGLATGGGGQSEATLQVDVFMDPEHVEIVLDIRDSAGGPVGAATVDMLKGVFPARYFPSPAEVKRLLRSCDEYRQGERWAEAWGCYGEVLELERGNREALAGQERIEARYVESAKDAIRRGEFAEARGHVERLRELSPEHPRVAELEGGDCGGGGGETRG